MTAPDPFPPDDVLAEALAASGTTVAAIARQPLDYSTSFPIDRVTVTFADGTSAVLAVKDLRWSSLLGDAPAIKPQSLHSPRRCIGVHRQVLAPANLGPRWWTAGSGEAPDGEWLAVELVDGNPLWEIGDLAVWEAVAVWLADFHRLTHTELPSIRRRAPELIEYSPDSMEPWLARARSALRSAGDERRDAAMERLDQLASDPTGPPTSANRCLVHGEFYPSNVIVAADGRICPIDWELAGIGDPAIDLAALVAGWKADAAERLVAAYAGRAGLPADDAELRDALEHWRALNAARWIGWSPGWRPPAAHDHDWIGDLVGDLWAAP